MNPLVSIGLPTYNRPQGLKNALDSLTNQQYRDIEIIVSVNPSPNEGINKEIHDILEQFCEKDSRIRRYYQTTNIGGTANFKFVFNIAVGKYFMYACDDDGWEKEFISDLIVPLEADENVSVAVPGIRRVTEDGREWDVIRLRGIDEHPFRYLASAIKSDYLPYVQVGLWRRSDMKRYDHYSAQLFGADIIIASEMLMSSKAVYVDNLLFTKGLDHNKIVDMIHTDPFGHIRVWSWLVWTLSTSQYIPIQRKLWIPAIAATNLVWVVRNYAAQVLFRLPVDHPIRKRIRTMRRQS